MGWWTRVSAPASTRSGLLTEIVRRRTESPDTIVRAVFTEADKATPSPGRRPNPPRHEDLISGGRARRRRVSPWPPSDDPPQETSRPAFPAGPGILRRIAESVDIKPGDTVLEIGPGPGGLTAQLAERSSRLIAIEKDRDLLDALRVRFPALSLVEGDALDLDWHQLVEQGHSGSRATSLTTSRRRCWSGPCCLLDLPA